MRTKIYKYLLSPSQIVPLPEGAKVLDISWVDENIFLWAEVDPEAPIVDRIFVPVITGSSPPKDGVYVRSAISESLVFHFYEVVQ